jgi:hypothetical protein
MYCNSCMGQIVKSEDVVYCSQCNVPLHSGCANHCLSCGKLLCDTCFAKNNFHCEECKPPEVRFASIRRSHIELYQACPYALYLQLVKKVRVPDGEHAKLGTIVHQLIDQLRSDLIDYDACCTLYESAFVNTEWEDELRETLYNRGRKSLSSFNEIMPLFTSDKWESEVNIIYSLDANLPSISCTLDAVDFIGDKIHVSDWKTGKPMSGQKLITDLQAPLYIEAIHQKYGVYPDTFTFYYLEEGKIKKYEADYNNFEYDENGNTIPVYHVNSGRNTYTLSVRDALQRTKEILTKINNGQFSMPTQVHEWYCKNMCYFYKSEICASSMKEQWNVLNAKYAEEK